MAAAFRGARSAFLLGSITRCGMIRRAISTNQQKTGRGSRNRKRKSILTTVERVQQAQRRENILKSFIKDVHRTTRRGTSNAVRNVVRSMKKSQQRMQAAKPRKSFAVHLKEVIQILHDSKCFDIRVYNSQRRLICFDLMIVATSFTDRQAHVVARRVGQMAKEANFVKIAPKPLKIDDGWACLECRDIVLSILVQQKRAEADWEKTYKHELIPESFYSNPLSFEPPVPPEPTVAWFHELEEEDDA